MEDFEAFARRRLLELREERMDVSKPREEKKMDVSLLREESDVHQPSRPLISGCHGASLIRFRGLAILPPLLSGEQREEMQRHRQAAQAITLKRRSLAEARMSYVHNMLHSVHLRSAPTLEEFHQGESGLTAPKQVNLSATIATSPSSSQHDDVIASHSDYTKDSLSSSPPTVLMHGGKPLGGGPALTSTAYSAFSTNHLPSPRIYTASAPNHTPALTSPKEPASQPGSQEWRRGGQDGEELTSDPLADISHQSLSSGYVTYENAENADCASARTGAGESPWPGALNAEGMLITQGGYFLHNTSDPASPGPGIISHPPIDAEDLEFSCTEEPAHCDDVMTGNPAGTAAYPGVRLLTPPPSYGDEDAAAPLGDPRVTRPGIVCEFLGTSAHRRMSLAEHTERDQAPPLQEADSAPPPAGNTESNGDARKQDGEPGENREGNLNSEPPREEEVEGPYRLSLQTLLKKSQEHRLRQRQLRNQARAARTQERGGEQGRRRGQEEEEEEEHGLSDKENDAFPSTGRTRERRRREPGHVQFSVPAAETFRKEAWVPRGGGGEEEDHPRGEGRDEEERGDGKTETGGRHLDGGGDCRARAETLFTGKEGPTFEDVHLDLSPEVVAVDSLPQSAYPALEAPPQTRGLGIATGPARPPSLGGRKFQAVPTPQLCMSPIRCKSASNAKPQGGAVGAPNRNLQVSAPLKAEPVVSLEKKGHPDSEGLAGSPQAYPVARVGVAASTSRSREQAEQMAQLELNLSSLKALISDLANTLSDTADNHKHTLSSRFDGELTEVNLDLVTNLNHIHLESSRREYDDDDSGLISKQQTGTARGGPGGVTIGPAPPCRVQWLDRVAPAKEVSIAVNRKLEEGRKRQQAAANCVTSLAQKMRVPDAFRKVPPPETVLTRKGPVLSDASNHPPDRVDLSHFLSLNRSYDVDTPSGLWLQEGSGSGSELKGHDPPQQKQLTPESEGGAGGQGGVSRAKRRLVMHATTGSEGRRGGGVRPQSSTPKGSGRRAEGVCVEDGRQQQLRRTHAAQIRELQEEQRRQQQQLLQSLPPTPSTQVSPSSLPVCQRPLVAAAVKGFLTRRLLRTERLGQLLRTIKDTQTFLQAFQPQTPGRGEFSSRQDLALLERVTLQLRSARYEVHDVFFSLSARERMRIISWDRQLARDRQLRRQSVGTGQSRGRSSLSAATQKVLERRRGVMIQTKAAERQKEAQSGVRGEPGGVANSQLKPNPRRVPKTSRPR